MLLNIKQWFKNHDFRWKFKLIISLPIMATLIALDWISKAIVVATMNQGDSKVLIKNFISAIYQINPGSAYSMNADNVALTIALATIVTFVLLIFWIFINDKKWIITISLVFSGSFANLLARAWAPIITIGEHIGTKGGVVDFLHWDFSFLGSSDYIFNLADLWVNFGIVAMVVVIIIEIVNAIILLIKKHKQKQNK